MAGLTGPFDLIPNELMIQIFELLDGDSLMVALKVCRRWRGIALYATRNQKSLWYYVCRQDLAPHSMDTVEKYIKISRFQNTRYDYWLRVYKTATYWKGISRIETVDDLVIQRHSGDNDITSSCALGRYVVTGHKDGHLTIWHPSAGRIVEWQKNKCGSGLYRVTAVCLVLVRPMHEQQSEESGGESPKSLESPESPESSASSESSESAWSNESGAASTEGEGYDDLSPYEVYWTCAGTLERTSFVCSMPTTISVCCGGFKNCVVKDPYVICWGYPIGPVTIFTLTDNVIGSRTEISSPREGISSLGVWGNKAKAVLMNNRLAELDLSSDNPSWDLNRNHDSPRWHKLSIHPSYQYAGGLYLGILVSGGIWVENSKESTAFPGHVNLDLHHTCSCVLLHGKLLAIGTRSGAVILYYVNTNLWDIASYVFLKALQVTTTNERVDSLDIVDGLNPILAVITLTTVSFVNFRLD